MMAVYLDFNATTPIDHRVLEAMISVYRDHYGNAASRTHIFGQKAKQLVERARGQVASLLQCDKAEVFFTSGATESNNIVILGLASWGAKHGRKHIISTAIEHKSVLEPLQYLASRGFEVELVPVDSSGRVKEEEIIRRVRSDTLLVSVMHANNETGIIQPVKEIGRFLANTSTYFHVDAAQTFGKLVLELRSLKYDFLTVSGHKIFGPQGIGALIVRRRYYQRPPIQPITFGGGQEGGLRPGTLPVALIVGLGLAAEIAEVEHEQWKQHAVKLRRQIFKQLQTVNYELNGDQKYCLPHVLNVSFPGVDSEALMLMAKDHIAISNGSACTSHDYKPSHVLTAMGLLPARIASAIRISWGPSIQKVDLSPCLSFIASMQS